MSQTLDELRNWARDHSDVRVEFTALADDLEQKEAAELASRPPPDPPPPPDPQTPRELDVDAAIESSVTGQTRLDEEFFKENPPPPRR